MSYRKFSDVLYLFLKQLHGLVRAVPIFASHLCNRQSILGLFVVLQISLHPALVSPRVLFEEFGLYEDRRITLSCIFFIPERMTSV